MITSIEVSAAIVASSCSGKEGAGLVNPLLKERQGTPCPSFIAGCLYVLLAMVGKEWKAGCEGVDGVSDKGIEAEELWVKGYDVTCDELDCDRDWLVDDA